ncbi:MAG: hypothetical protein ACRC3Y_06725 [Romboutsia sp.]|uniref:hypothetical protein n=1 Tax=Romboutsia sp. TaxID=1965302 RepID=UPI003F416A68
MRMYFKGTKRSRSNESSIPNAFAFTFIRNFLTDKQNKQIREEYFIGDLSSKQVNQAMQDIKWLFKSYKGLDVVTIENKDGDVSKFIL